MLAILVSNPCCDFPYVRRTFLTYCASLRYKPSVFFHKSLSLSLLHTGRFTVRLYLRSFFELQPVYYTYLFSVVSDLVQNVVSYLSEVLPSLQLRR